MSAEHLIPVPLANRFGGITCLKVCYYFNGKRPYGKSQAHALEVIVKIKIWAIDQALSQTYSKVNVQDCIFVACFWTERRLTSINTIYSENSAQVTKLY